jgi:hypothetical protein
MPPQEPGAVVGRSFRRILDEVPLAHARTDPGLASLREDDALAKLPEEERDACRKLWADVDALLKRVKDTKNP